MDNEVISGTIVHVENAARQTALPPALAAARNSHINLTKVDVADLFLKSRRNDATRKNYAGDLKLFFGADASVELVQDFLAWPPPQITLALEAHRAQMVAAKNSPASINRRLSAVRSLLKFAFKLGLSQTDGRNLIESEQTQGYRDTRGLDKKQTMKLLKAPRAIHGDTLRGLRDTAMVRIFILNGLRNNELRMIDVEDVSLFDLRISVLRKRRGGQRLKIDIDAATGEVVEAYRRAMNIESGPLFRNLSRNPKFAGNRISNRGIWQVINSYTEPIGVAHLHPHKCRHTAVTNVAIANGHDLVETMDFSGHKDPRVVMLYIHQSRDLQKRATERLVSMFDDKPKRPKKP